MSLIEEALKKQQDELNSVKTPETPADTQAQPPEPPPIPEGEAAPPAVSDEEAPAKSRRSLTPILGAIAGIIFLAAIAVWLLQNGFSRFFSRSEPQSATTNVAVRPAAAATHAVRPAVTGAVANPAPATVGNVVMPAATTVSVNVASGTAVDAGGTNKSPSTGVTTSKPPWLRRPPAMVTKPEITWPNLTLTGVIVDPAGVRSSALINNQRVSEGESVEGVKVMVISRQGVKVAYEGETRILRVGVPMPR